MKQCRQWDAETSETLKVKILSDVERDLLAKSEFSAYIY
jgi:hypothetical protein